MTNDAKLGMLVGVLGVIVAAVLFTNVPPPAQSQPSADALPDKQKDAPPTVATVAPPEVKSAGTPLPSTPVVRTRKETDAQPTSRPSGTEEEP